MAGVPGLFWRSPAVFWGPSTPNPTWILRKPLILKNWPISLYACGNGLNLPHLAERAFGDQMDTNMQKAMPFGSHLHQGLKKLRTFSKNVFIFRLFLGSTGCFPRFSRCWPYFVAGRLLFGGSGCTRKAKSNLSSTENPYFLKKWPDLWHKGFS